MGFDKYNFNQPSLSFLKQIEEDYKQEIAIVEIELDFPKHGFAKVIKGIPTIEIGIHEVDKEEIIIHEAYHLRLRYDGMPNISFKLPHGSKTEDNKFYLEWFVHLFWDKINHHFFYHRVLEDLHLDPFQPFKRELDTIFAENEIKGLKEATKEIALAGYSFKSGLKPKMMNMFLDFLSFSKIAMVAWE